MVRHDATRTRYGRPVRLVDTDALLKTDGSLPFGAIRRYAGLDYPHHSRWRAFVRRAGGDHIRTINWLTILDGRRAEILGGIDAIRAELGENCPIHAFDGGIVIQAGERPAIADVNRNAVPPEYKAVSRLTRELRYERFTGNNGLLKVTWPLDSVTETLKWLARFD
ncbi:DUF3396 domain-containing protein [Aliihoeflea aestuarii]|jgi:hypothetical protein|uniref:type VI immunity family protein n=1 Tax=Aliihoeflea aestuarii TaxID=453840 RepID=UPI0020931044|nr:type VI immunity family protein [Aliihoeflea aestuarii]MCO6391728.1 DUF3396 domain-containing protein [Aliihoeflea aestuarii]